MSRDADDLLPRSGPIGAARHLFAAIPPEVSARLSAYPEMLRRVLPLRPAMIRELPRLVRELSMSLTAEREGGPRPGYLSEPRTLSAYAWYYLPWNLMRLSRLLPGLDLNLPDGGLVCDLGSGPLTFVQALWLSRPDLRRKKLRISCLDRSKRALDLGLGLFTELAGFDPTAPDAPWSIRVTRGEYWQGLTGGADLIAMVNVANELAGTSRDPLDSRMERVAAQLTDALAPGGRALIVEPGTRLGWRCLLGMREAFIELDMDISAPCPHREECVLVGGRTRAWCHFNMSSKGAPKWLTTFSDRANLGKERLSLSFLLARKTRPTVDPKAVRIVSGAFALADVPGSAVYGCSESGLTVLVAPDRRPPFPGDLLAVAIPPNAPLDAKSGAPRVTLPVDPDAPAPARPQSERSEQAGAPAKPRPSARPRGAGKPGRVGGDAAGRDRNEGKSRPGGTGTKPTFRARNKSKIKAKRQPRRTG
ncbi:small ribosomal subunit Rsm22 family protein [Desulfovibrio sp. TomC]|uniref:small ribosomal subunit Rsm22 family protein n=1 Tax=Desulfovibrio sp. TomC TaxID=1562888 RepID=UPI000573301E|nr:small ribosomal subunit Rsm22 family protein [Desulfovibrio sp. TomC]KHK00487.1 hypothetical protein NY78_4143 [Desulfovibrio sp. TomC]